MATRCNPGDIAIVINAENRRNRGLIVRVIEPHDGRVSELGRLAIAGPYWLVQSPRAMLYVTRTKRFQTKLGPVADSLLVPIRGNYSEEQVEQLASKFLNEIHVQSLAAVVGG